MYWLSRRRLYELALAGFFDGSASKCPQARHLKNMVFFPKIGVVFNRIRKNASSSATSFLNYIDTGRLEPSMTVKEDRLHLDQLGPITGTRALVRSHRVVLVRDPYSRTLSAFLNKFSSPNYRSRFGNFEPNPSGFKLFLSFLENGGLRANQHWSPQSDQMLLASKSYSHTLKFSEYPKNLGTLSEELWPGSQQLWLEFEEFSFGGPKPTNSSDKVGAFFNTADLDRVDMLFERDLLNPIIQEEAQSVRDALS